MIVEVETIAVKDHPPDGGEPVAAAAGPQGAHRRGGDWRPLLLPGSSPSDKRSFFCYQSSLFSRYSTTTMMDDQLVNCEETDDGATKCFEVNEDGRRRDEKWTAAAAKRTRRCNERRSTRRGLQRGEGDSGDGSGDFTKPHCTASPPTQPKERPRRRSGSWVTVEV